MRSGLSWVVEVNGLLRENGPLCLGKLLFYRPFLKSTAPIGGYKDEAFNALCKLLAKASGS